MMRPERIARPNEDDPCICFATHLRKDYAVVKFGRPRGCSWCPCIEFWKRGDRRERLEDAEKGEAKP